LAGITVLSGGGAIASLLAMAGNLGLVDGPLDFVVGVSAVVLCWLLTGAQMNKGDVLSRGRPFIFDLYRLPYIESALAQVGLGHISATTVRRALIWTPMVCFGVFSVATYAQVALFGGL
jgi:hypothetical protein